MVRMAPVSQIYRIRRGDEAMTVLSDFGVGLDVEVYCVSDRREKSTDAPPNLLKHPEEKEKINALMWSSRLS